MKFISTPTPPDKQSLQGKLSKLVNSSILIIDLDSFHLLALLSSTYHFLLKVKDMLISSRHVNIPVTKKTGGTTMDVPLPFKDPSRKWHVQLSPTPTCSEPSDMATASGKRAWQIYSLF